MEQLVSACESLVEIYAALPLFPIFSSATFIVSAVALRQEPGSLEFTHRHPVASCVMNFIVACSGAILANLVTGKPPLDFVTNHLFVASGIVIWYLVFFSPFDVFFYLTGLWPVDIFLKVANEFGRAKKIMAAVLLARSVYPSSFVAMAIAGMLKGSGKRWGVTWYRLVYRPQSASKHELIAISLTTKLAFTIGLLFAVNLTAPFINSSLLLFVAGSFLAFMKLSTKFITDPYRLPQSTVWSALTSLSVSPPMREEEQCDASTGEDVRVVERGRGEGVKKGASIKRISKHTKVD